MKKILLSLTLTLLLLSGMAQNPVRETSPQSFTDLKQRLMAGKNFNPPNRRSVPILRPSTLNGGVDTVGGMLYNPINESLYLYTGGDRWIQIAENKVFDGLFSGGNVTWSGVGLIFDVSASVYYIKGVRYTTSAQQITLTAADVTNPRIDIIGLDSTGVIKLTGVPASNPAKPQVFPIIQIELTSILLPANATTPGSFESIIYDENIEYTTSSSGPIVVNFNSVTLPFHGTVAAEVTSSDLYGSLKFTNPAPTVLGDAEFLKFYIKLTSPWTVTNGLLLTVTPADPFLDESILFIHDGEYGFSVTEFADYQSIVIPISAFGGSPTSLISAFKLTPLESVYSTFYIDYMHLQGGISPPPTTTGVLSFKGRTGHVVPIKSDYSEFFVDNRYQNNHGNTLELDSLIDFNVKTLGNFTMNYLLHGWLGNTGSSLSYISTPLSGSSIITLSEGVASSYIVQTVVEGSTFNETSLSADSTKLKKRATYGTNLGSTFTKHTLVDKNYVDSSLSRSGIKATFYVSENYTGTGGAVIANLSNTGVSSSNGTYTSQLSNAQMGSINSPFPDPWTARNAALDSIANGSISDATIIVIKGIYTVGSDVAANNGDSTGVAATATVADIGFTSVDGNDTSSLMKNKVRYIFNPGTGLILINKTYAIHAGCYNVDVTNTAFVSAIYGEGDFTIIYGSVEGISQRFIQIKNSRCEIRFEANNVVVQGPWNYVWTYKTEYMRIKKFIGDKLTMLVHMQNSAGEDNGDGQPADLTMWVDYVYRGYTYFPYPSGNLTSGYRPLIALDASDAIRQKTVNINIKSVYLYDVAIHVLCNAWATGITRNVENWTFNLNIDYLQHDLNDADQAFQTVAGGIIAPITGNLPAYSRKNTHQNFTIKEAVVDHSLVSLRTQAPTNAASTNNSITFNIDYAIRRRMVLTGGTINNLGARSMFTLPYLPWLAPDVIAGERVHVFYNVKRAIAKEGNMFGEFSWHETHGTLWPWYAGNTIISGSYITEDGSPVMELNGKGEACVLKDAIFIAKGSATNSIVVNNGSATVKIYTKDFLTNLGFGAGLTQDGNYTIDATILNYY